MRTLLLFSAIALAFVSCKNMEKFRAPIEGLTTNWDSTTSMLTDFISTLQNAQQELQSKYAQLTIPEGVALSEESAQQFADLKKNYNLHLGDLTELGQEVNDFVSDWQSQADNLTALKNDLSTGALGSETMEKVENLESTVESAKTSVEDWQGELEDVRENTDGLVEQFRAMVTKLQHN